MIFNSIFNLQFLAERGLFIVSGHGTFTVCSVTSGGRVLVDCLRDLQIDWASLIHQSPTRPFPFLVCFLFHQCVSTLLWHTIEVLMLLVRYLRVKARGSQPGLRGINSSASCFPGSTHEIGNSVLQLLFLAAWN